MAKKPITPKKTEGTASAAAEKPKTAAKKPAKAGTAKTVKGTKAAAPRTIVKSAPVTQPGTAVAASITPADIALRAYFISEKRKKLGLPGDSTSDWVEAERQLKAEAVKPKA